MARISVCRLGQLPRIAASIVLVCAMSPLAHSQDDSMQFEWNNTTRRYFPQTPLPQSEEPPDPNRPPPPTPSTPTQAELPINAKYMGRAAVISDSTRLAGHANGYFLPSAIPVTGQAFFGTGQRASVQGNGSAIDIQGIVADPGIYMEGRVQLAVTSATFPIVAGGDAFNAGIRQAYGRINRLTLGVMDTAFADPSAEPETLDLAGPSAKITTNPSGFGSATTGRISYEVFSDEPDGFDTFLSLEDPRPYLPAIAGSGTFATYPDFVASMQYVAGDWIEGSFYERWHVQYAAVIRDLGLEFADATEQNVFGWGMALSGAYRFQPRRCLTTSNRLMFSVAYGEGISRYITDLNKAPDTFDAVLDGTGTLVALPALAWYVGYSHNWTDNLRSTATYSQVDLDSVPSPVVALSPYTEGQYVGVNLVYHDTFFITEAGKDKPHNFYTGLEWLYGHKTSLDGADGDAHRIMWVTVISK